MILEDQENLYTNLFQLNSLIKNTGLFFCYAGPLTQGIIEEMGDAIKSRIIFDSQNTTIALKIFSIFVEQAQNIIKYSSYSLSTNGFPNSRLKDSLIILGKKQEKYFIGFGNLIENSQLNQLKARLDKIRKMDKRALKIFYKEQMHKALDIESTSLGIGLIEIAKNASDPIEYEIQKVNQDYSFFALHASVCIRS